MNTWDENNQNSENTENMQPVNNPAETEIVGGRQAENTGSAAAPQEDAAAVEDISSDSGSQVSEEPQNPASMESDYTGSYSSYQQPYAGQPQQYGNPYNNGGYQNPYNTQPNPYGGQYQGGMYRAPQQYGNPYGQGYRQQYQQPGQSYPYNYQQTPRQPAEQKPPVKKKKTGKIIFACLLAAAVISGGVGIAYAVRSSMHGVQADPAEATTTTTAGQNKNEGNSAGKENLNLSPTPSGNDVAVDQSGKMTPEQVYEKLSKSNVGIVLYSGDGGTVMGQGSGIIMSQSGYILTCAHVIDGATNAKIRVVLDDNTEYDATIVGYDARTDIGVVKITPKGTLNVAQFGDSNALKVGEQVIAIGNPGGLQFFGSFSDGKVSAIDRPVNSSIGYTMKCVQHTAAISPGNSGGMLVNMYGQVIGINSSKIAQTDYEGIGFAIPISSAKPIIDDIINYGYVKDRAKLGISYNKINANYQYYMAAYSYGMPTGSIVVEGISEDSDVNNYGVKRYDFITAINGKELEDGSELTEFIENSKPGDKITLTISRISNGAIKTFEVTCKLVEDKGSVVTSNDDSQPEDNADGNNPFGGNGQSPFGNGQNPFGGNNPFGFGY